MKCHVQPIFRRTHISWWIEYERQPRHLELNVTTMSIDAADMIHVQIMNALYHPTILRTGWWDIWKKPKENMMVTNYGLRLRISQQNQSIEQWASITAYTSIYPLISVSILHKGLNAAFAFGARLIYISAGRNPVNLFFNTCVSIDRSIDLYSHQKIIQHSGLTVMGQDSNMVSNVSHGW